MSAGVARCITPTDTPCPRGCGDRLVLTRDAIGRARPRCPTCQQVNTRPMDAGTVGVQHSQAALDSRALAWPLPALRRGIAAPTARPPIRCRACGVELPRTGRPGRPRTMCADRAACQRRAARTPSP